jgi:hypothetical protein
VVKLPLQPTKVQFFSKNRPSFFELTERINGINALAADLSRQYFHNANLFEEFLSQAVVAISIRDGLY